MIKRFSIKLITVFIGRLVYKLVNFATSSHFLTQHIKLLEQEISYQNVICILQFAKFKSAFPQFNVASNFFPADSWHFIIVCPSIHHDNVDHNE